MPYNLKSLKRRRRTEILSEDVRPKTADNGCSGHYYNDSKVLSMVDLTMLPSRSFQQEAERPRTASGIPLDRERNGLSLNPPTPFVYDRISQSLKPASRTFELQPPEPQIGLALGSPRELLDYEPEPTDDSSRPQFNRWHTFGPDSQFVTNQLSQLNGEDHRPLKPKVKRWKSVSGFLGRIRSPSVAPPPVPPIPVQSNCPPVAVPASTSTVKSSIDHARKSLHMKRKTKTSLAPSPAKDEKNKRQYPALVIPQSIPLVSGPVSAMSPQIDITIPTAELDRYSVIFGDSLHQQRQSRPFQSLLERRQRAGVDLKLIDPVVKQRISTQPQLVSVAPIVAAAEHRPARSSSLLHLQGHSVAAPSGFKYDRISTASQPLFIAQEEEEYEYEDYDAFEDDDSSEASNSSTLMTDVDEMPVEAEMGHVPKAPSRAPPPPPPAFVFSMSNPHVDLVGLSRQVQTPRSATSISSRNSWSSAAVALIPSPTWSTGLYFPPSPTLSTSDIPPSPYLSPWDPSAPFSTSPSLVTCSPGMLSEQRFYSPGLTPPPHSAMSNTSKFGYDAPHSPLLAIARTVSVMMTGKKGGDLRTSAVHDSSEHLGQETEAKQQARFLTRSRSERLVGGYSSSRVATPTFVSVADARSYHESDVNLVVGQGSDVVCSGTPEGIASGDMHAHWAATRRSCRGSVIDPLMQTTSSGL